MKRRSPSITPHVTLQQGSIGHRKKSATGVHVRLLKLGKVFERLPNTPTAVPLFYTTTAMTCQPGVFSVSARLVVKCR